MQKHYSEVCGQELDRWSSLLLMNATMLDQSGGLEDAMGRFAANLAKVAGVESCLLLLPYAGGDYRIIARSGGDALDVDCCHITGKASEAMEKRRPALALANDLGLGFDARFDGTDFQCVPLVSHGKAVGLAALYTMGRR